MEMASLSVYKGILNRTVPKAFYRLLWAARGDSLEAFLNAWGDFYDVLCMRGYSENLAGCITGTALFDENAFSLAAAAGTAVLPEGVRRAVRRDLAVIRQVASITPQEIPCAMSCIVALSAHCTIRPQARITASSPASISSQLPTRSRSDTPSALPMSALSLA